MTPDRWRKISQLYHEALARETNERGRFLADGCAGDEALRREVESLLANEGTAEGFLAATCINLPATAQGEDLGHRELSRAI